MKTNFSEGMEENGFTETAKYLRKGAISKSVAVLMAGVLMAGCQSTQSNYDETIAHYQNETNSKVEVISEDTISNISDGRSGVFSSDKGIVFISNYDKDEPLSKNDEDALSNVVSDFVLEQSHSFYTQSDVVKPSSQHKDSDSAHYIHVEKDAFKKATETLGMHDNVDMLKEYGNKFVILHELGHFYTSRYITEGHDSFSQTQKRETSADIIAASLLAKTDDMNLPEFNKLIDQMKDLRSNSAYRTGELDHFTNQGLAAIQNVYNNNPELYEEMKSMSIKEVVDLSITASSELSDNINPNVKQAMLASAKDKVRSDYDIYLKEDSLPNDSNLSGYYRGKGDGLKLQMYYLKLAKENQEMHPEYSDGILDTIAKNMVKLQVSSYIAENIDDSSEITIKLKEKIEDISTPNELIVSSETSKRMEGMSI